ncbi:MAG TPA: hypothetical protein VGO59_03065 [Verrucomicrobiae bacterium]
MSNRTGNRAVKTWFGSETRFEIDPLPSAPVPERGLAENALEQLKKRLLRELLAAAREPGMNVALRRAANDAASAAWFTPFPLLVFPALLEEKAAGALQRQKRQKEIRHRTQALLEQAIAE